MTDRGRTAGWTAAALLGPVAAAVFAGTTVWTAAHAPAPTSTESTSTTGPVRASGDSQQILDDTARIAALEHLVATLRAQASSLARPAAARPAAGPAKDAAAATPSTQAAARSPIATRPATRPPAVHAVTGASSATKGQP